MWSGYLIGRSLLGVFCPWLIPGAQSQFLRIFLQLVLQHALSLLLSYLMFGTLPFYFRMLLSRVVWALIWMVFLLGYPPRSSWRLLIFWFLVCSGGGGISFQLLLDLPLFLWMLLGLHPVLTHPVLTLVRHMLFVLRPVLTLFLLPLPCLSLGLLALALLRLGLHLALTHTSVGLRLARTHHPLSLCHPNLPVSAPHHLDLLLAPTPLLLGLHPVLAHLQRPVLPALMLPH